MSLCLCCLTQAEWEVLNDAEKGQRLELAINQLSQAGAHFVVDTIADMPQVIVEINRRLKNGERP